LDSLLSIDGAYTYLSIHLKAIQNELETNGFRSHDIIDGFEFTLTISENKNHIILKTTFGTNNTNQNIIQKINLGSI